MWCVLIAAAAAQDRSHLAPPKRAAQAVRTSTPPVIDGKLDDAAWATAPVLTDFVDLTTDELAEDQTIARVLFDDEYLYVAYEVMQPKEDISANVFKYDRIQIRFEDYVQIGLDTFHDGGQAYLFVVSPIGTRWDAREGLFGRNESWDADWDAKTVITDDRWFAELRIPIGVMHLNRNSGETWGLNFRRRFAKKNDSTHWNYDPGSGFSRRAMGPKFVNDFGLLEDLDLSDMKVQREPKVETYVSATSTRPEGDTTHLQMSTGLDAELRISSHWTTQFTVNPDFGEIAADEGDVQNRDTARFLNERRTFFNEGAELFQSPTLIYDSRQITDINAAAKITGTGEDWALASLILRGEGTRAGDNADFLVTRYTQNATDEVQLGATLVGVNREIGDNTTFGLDSRIEMTPTAIWTTQYLTMIGEDPITEGSLETESISGHSLFSEIEWGTKPWAFELSYRDISENFDPDLGFIPRTDIRGPKLEVDYNEDFQGDYLEGFWIMFETEHYTGHNNETKLRDYFVWSSISFQNDWDLSFQFQDDFHDPYNNTSKGIGLTYNRQDRYKSWRTQYLNGTFQNVDFDQYELTKPFKLAERWTNDLTGVFRQEDRVTGNENVWLYRLESEYTTAWDGRVKLTVEATADRAYSRTLLFAYEEVKNWDFFLVLNDFRDSEVLGEEVVRSLFAKFIYHW